MYEKYPDLQYKYYHMHSAIFDSAISDAEQYTRIYKR